MTVHSIDESGGAVGISSLPPVSDRINSGAFGVLYHDPRNPLQCIKVLKKPITGDTARSLHRLVDIVHWARPSDREHLLHRFAWPVELFGSADQVNGYAMPLAPPSCYFELRVVNKTTQSPLQLKFLMDTDYWDSPAIRSEEPLVTFQDRVEIALDCVDSIDIIHDNGLCYGDVSSNNIVARLEASRPGAFFFDADSITTAEHRAAQPLETPDWDTPAHVDPLAIDRSRVALLVFRLLVMRPRVRPEGDELALLPVHTGGQLSEALAETYFAGGTEAFLSLANQLRRLRDAASERRAMEQALESGFARVVLRERPASLGVDDLHLVEQARKQVEFEQLLDNAEGWELQRLLRKARYSGNPFSLDTCSLEVQPRPPSTSEQLHELISDVRFGEVGTHMASAALGTLERDGWLPRAVQHAHVEIDEVTLQTVVRPGAGDFSFSWPANTFVNLAEIAVNGPGIGQTEVVHRAPGEATATLSFAAPRGTSGMASLRLGTLGATGLTVMSPRTTEIPLTIPALPKQPVPLRARNQARLSAQTPLLFDPVKAAAAEAARLRAVRRLRLRNASLICTLVLLVGSAGWWFLRDGPAPPDRPPLTVAAGSATYRLEVDGNNVTIEPSGLPADVVRLEVRRSSDGEVGTWTLLPTTTNPVNGATLISIDASPGEPLLLRIQPYNSRGNRPVYRAQASWLDGSGLRAHPVADSREPGRTDISWIPVVEGDIPVSFEVRTQRVTGPPTEEAITGTRFVVEAPPTGRSFFAVRSVFANGTTGPWIETSPVPSSFE